MEILATTLPNGVREQFYRTPALTARGGKAPYQWSVDGGALPPGLRLDETSGIIEGVPTTAGQYKFLVVAWDFTFPAISADADDAEYTIIISPN